jgi:hypothetical protein
MISFFEKVILMSETIEILHEMGKFVCVDFKNINLHLRQIKPKTLFQKDFLQNFCC